MSVDNDVRLLIITEHSYNWFDLLLEEKIIRTVEIASTFGEFEKFTSDQVIDIILLEAELFGDNLEPVINKITLQSPRSLVAVLTNDISNEYYDCVVSMGVVDVLPMDVKPSYMIQRINALLHRWQDQVDAESRTRKLQAISVLSQKLHESENPSIMFVTAIDFICTYFDVLGVAITLQNNDGMRLYAGSEDIDNHRRLYESHSMMNVHDPLRQVIITGMPLVFSDISEHMHFTPIPVISNPKMALIVPFRNASRIVGSLAVFSSDDSLSWTDVAIFELIALNLGTAYFNTTHYHMQEVSVQSMRYVIQAWYRLSSVYDRNEIAELTYDHIIDAVDMNAAGIWLFSPDDNPDVIYSGNPLLQDVLQEIYELGAQNLIL